MRIWPFKKQSFFDPQETAWLADRMNWLVAEFGIETGWASRSIVLPDAKTFRTGGKTGHQLAEYVLDQVKEKAGLPDLDITLVGDDPQPEYVGDNLSQPVHPDTPAGTYHRQDRFTQIITYNPSLLRQPIQLVATLAHELSHAMLDSRDIDLPVDDELELELLTDLTAVFLGYGIFMSNSAFEYQQFQDGSISGWRYQRLGYLPQNQLVFATAIFSSLKNSSDEAIVQFLRPGLAATYTKAKSHLLT